MAQEPAEHAPQSRPQGDGAASSPPRQRAPRGLSPLAALIVAGGKRAAQAAGEAGEATYPAAELAPAEVAVEIALDD